MKLIRQTTGTTCGQCCIAMLLEISEADSIGLVGHDKITSEEDLLTTLVWACSPKARPDESFTLGVPPSDIIALVKHREPNGVREHWTVWDRGLILDPACHKKLWPAYKYLPVS